VRTGPPCYSSCWIHVVHGALSNKHLLTDNVPAKAMTHPTSRFCSTAAAAPTPDVPQPAMMPTNRQGTSRVWLLDLCLLLGCRVRAMKSNVSHNCSVVSDSMSEVAVITDDNTIHALASMLMSEVPVIFGWIARFCRFAALPLSFSWLAGAASSPPLYSCCWTPPRSPVSLR